MAATLDNSHTPGPWRVQIGDEPGEWDVTTDEDEPWFICTCHDGIDGNPQRANAKLIAAAPDLLAALKYAFRFVDRDRCDWAFIDSAIYKAEGK